MGKSILVIDDDAVIRKAFTLALEDTGYQVDTVESGQKGIEAKKSTGYDLIFLDLNMPGMDGIEVLREIRKFDDRVPIYIVTAFHQQFFDQLRAAEKDGIKFELLKKPIGGDQILMLTKSVLESPVCVQRKEDKDD